jgi:nucleotide-binding universal stress UspA family protein
MYKRMLVPLDGSKLAEETFPYARELAGRLDLDLDFLHVCFPFESPSIPMRQVYVDTLAGSAREQIKRIQNETIGKESTRPIEVRSKVVTGYPAEEILKYSEENTIDIVLMATHGESGVRRWALGSVAYQVLHASKIPVWLIRSGLPNETVFDQWPQKTILVPLDGSKLAESALPHAEALARQRGVQVTEILLLSVYAPSISPATYYFHTDYPPTVPLKYADFIQQEIDQAKERCEKYLKSIANELVSKGFRVRIESVMGNVSEEIIKCTKKNPFQLIVMASHGRSGISHLTFGSVAERVLLEASVPIFMVIPDGRTKPDSSKQSQDDKRLAEIETVDEDRDL